MRAISGLFLAGLILSTQALALDLGSLSNADAVGGLKDATDPGYRGRGIQARRGKRLSRQRQGQDTAARRLEARRGRPAPDGMQKQADELVTAMNRAAEQAVPEAKALLVSAIKSMSVQDAKGILTGNDTAATEYFRKTPAAS